MSRKSIAVPLLAGALFLCLVTIGSSNLITYTTSEANRAVLMVMDDTGADPTVLHRGAKFSPISAVPSISPAGGPEGTWITFNEYYDIYKIRPDGTGLDLVLCGGGEDINRDPYSLLWGSEWSPDGSEILVYSLTQDGKITIALVPATHTAEPGENCPSELAPVYYPPGEFWDVYGTAAWSHDGSRIVVFEEEGMTEEKRLVELVRQESGDWLRLHPIPPDPASSSLPEIRPYGLAWQPGTNLLVFRVRENDARRGGFWLAGINLETGLWDYVRDADGPIAVDVSASPTWSTDGSQLVYTEEGGNIVRWDYPDGARTVIGSGGWADWQRDALVLDCAVSGCDDGNPCTVGTCEQTGNCTYQPASVGTACTDGDICTQSDVCNESGQCVGGSPAEDETTCDLVGSLCCSGICGSATCNSSADCFDGDSCTTDLCFGGNTCAAYCQNDPIQGCQSCSTKGASCASNSDCCSNKCRGRRCK